ncbi:MAG: hypothetical protein AB7V46_04470 [Thermomicrobiales bacterium]
MSDRRRNPPKDEWDDDLDLAGFDRPPSSRTYSARTSPPKPPVDPYDPNEDFLAEDPLPRPPGSRPPSSSPSYGSARARYADPYERPVDRAVRAPAGTRPYSREGSGELDEYGSGYDVDPYAQPPGATRSSRSRTYPVQPGIDAQPSASAYNPDYAEADYPESSPQRRPTRTREPRNRSAITVPKPAINDGAVVAVVAGSLLSIVFMVASIAAGAGDLPEWFPIHLDAAGNPDVWGTDAVLWRIPFGALMAMVMALIIAGFLWKRDRFAARMAIVGTAAIQVLAWVALIDFIW